MASEIAVIVPVYNEEDNVLPMAREVSEAMKKSGFVADALARHKIQGAAVAPLEA